MKFYSLCLLGLVYCSNPLSAATFTTNASAKVLTGGFSTIFVFGGSGLGGLGDAQFDSQIDANSHAHADVLDQEFNVEHGLAFKRQAISEASASPGVLKTLASAGYVAENNGLGLGGTAAQAEAHAEFTDTIQVSGAGLFTKINAELRLSGGLENIASVKSGLQLSSFAGSGNISFSERTNVSPLFECSVESSQCSSGIMTLAVPTHTDIQISAFLTSYALALGRPQPGFPTSSLSDYANTGKIYFSPVDPNTHIFSSSGYSYAPPVPLPAGVWLFSSGLLMLLVRVKNRPKTAYQSPKLIF